MHATEDTNLLCLPHVSVAGSLASMNKLLCWVVVAVAVAAEQSISLTRHVKKNESFMQHVGACDIRVLSV